MSDVKRKKVFFLDRDGCLIEEENYLADPDKVRLCHGAAEALKAVRDAGYGIVMISNQSGIARGYFTMNEVKSVEKRIHELLAEAGAPVPDAWYYCPHHPKGKVPEFTMECDCRKPKPGMLLRAASEMGLDIENSVMIGDKTDDLKAGFAAGCRLCALVKTGHGSEQQIPELPGKYLVGTDILQAVRGLLEILLKQTANH